VHKKYTADVNIKICKKLEIKYKNEKNQRSRANALTNNRALCFFNTRAGHSSGRRTLLVITLLATLVAGEHFWS